MKKMNKVKLFVENFLVYGLCSVICKIIPLIMVPIVTRLMPNTEYYGVSDLSNTVMQFGCAFAVMGMYDAMYRMFFEKDNEDYKKNVCSTAFMFTLCTSFIVMVVMILCKNLIAKYFLGNLSYSYIIYLTATATFLNATNSIVSAPTRMQNKRKVYVAANFISPVIAYSVSIPLLLRGYYLIALPLATAISGAIIGGLFLILNRKWFGLNNIDGKLLKQMLAIALPLLPNFLIYWVFNSCDKVMITNLIGTAQAGIYSVGSKLGQLSQLIYLAFSGGWQFFSFSTMKEDNQVKNNSLIFEYLGIISFAATAFICAWSYPIFKLLFTEQYLSGYVVAPYLFLAPLLQMLFQVAANQFLVVKKTWPNMLILSAGALVNVAINYFLIPVLGIEGASIATLFGYAVSDVVCVIVLCKMKLMIISKRFVFASVGMCAYFVFWRLFISSNILAGSAIAIIATAYFVFLYKNDLQSLLNNIKIGRKLK